MPFEDESDCPERKQRIKDGITRNIDKRCGAIFELANGEKVTACHKPIGHEGDHEGWCLGSIAVWPQGFSSEEELNRPDN